MRERDFWWQKPGLKSGLLAPFAFPYGMVAARRMAEPSQPAAVPVICVGNFTLGGAGKTPTVIALVKLLATAGRKPFVLSRGYGGRLPGPVRVDPARHIAADVGDEPLLLARAAPTIVSSDRVAGAAAAVSAGAGVIVMDDGFQNPSLKKNLSVVVVDGRRGIGNGKVFPAGPLRAPLDIQFGYAQAVLMLGAARGANAVIAAAEARGVPVLHGRLEPNPIALLDLQQVPVLAFAGIGDPEKFFATLTEAGVDVRVKLPFPDHHPYSPDEAIALIARARSEKLLLVTTEKDMMRLSGESTVATLAGITKTLPVRLALNEEGAFWHMVLSCGG